MRRPACGPGRLLEQQTEERALGEPEQEQARQPEQQPGFPPLPAHPCGLVPNPEPASLRGGVGCGAWVSMSSLPGLARTGAPNSAARDGRGRGW
jgi:hypothetical protein